MQLTKYLSLAIAAAVAAVSAQEANGTIFDIVTAPNNTLGVDKFVALLSSDRGYAPIIDLLKGPGNFTTFIPNDKSLTKFVAAWKAYGKAHHWNVSSPYPAANLTMYNTTMVELIQYHVIPDRVNLTNITGNVDIENSALNASGVAFFNGSGLPLVIQNNGTAKDWNNQTWVQKNGQYLQYKIGNGNNFSVVTTKDVNATNGLVNVINGVLMPPGKPAMVLSQNKNITTLWKVLKTQPDLVNTLQNLTNFTLFAPSNKALRNVHFSGLSNDTIKNIILTHVVPGVYYSTNISQAAAANNGNVTVSAINNQSLPVFVNSTDGSITLNDTIRVIQANVLFNSGVMHVIDGLLMPTNSSM